MSNRASVSRMLPWGSCEQPLGLTSVQLVCWGPTSPLAKKMQICFRDQHRKKTSGGNGHCAIAGLRHFRVRSASRAGTGYSRPEKLVQSFGLQIQNGPEEFLPWVKHWDYVFRRNGRGITRRLAKASFSTIDGPKRRINHRVKDFCNLGFPP